MFVKLNDKTVLIYTEKNYRKMYSAECHFFVQMRKLSNYKIIGISLHRLKTTFFGVVSCQMKGTSRSAETAEIFSNILVYSRFSQLFRHVLYKIFIEHNETETRVIFHKNRYKIQHRTFHMRSFPGNLLKICISSDSTSLTESGTLF